MTERGVCTYLEKAKAVDSSGATAMILVNDRDGTYLGSRVRALLPKLHVTLHTAHGSSKLFLWLACSDGEDGVHPERQGARHQDSGRDGVEFYWTEDPLGHRRRRQR